MPMSTKIEQNVLLFAGFLGYQCLVDRRFNGVSWLRSRNDFLFILNRALEQKSGNNGRS